MDAVLIVAGLVALTMAILSLVAQVRTWQILKGISVDLGSFPGIAEARVKGEAEAWIEAGYIPNVKTRERIAEALSELDDDEAKSLLEQVQALKPVN